MMNQFSEQEVKTINYLFHSILGIETDIKSFNNPLAGNFMYYRKLNMLLPRFPSADIKRFVLAQNKANGMNKTVKRIFAAFCINSIGILASKSAAIDGIDFEKKESMFLLRRNAIRYFDFSSGHVTYVKKEGLPSCGIKNSLAFRRKYNYSFLVELLDGSENWFRERIIHGCSLSQVSDNYIYKKTVKKAMGHLREIISDTLTYKEPFEYTAELRGKIEEILSMPDIDQSINTDHLKSTIYKLCQKAEKLDKMVPIALTHGDFHPENILIDERQNTFLIDWETAAFRSIWYDPATLLLKFRRPDMREKILKNYDKHDIAGAVLINDQQKKYPMEAVIAVLLLEYINEVCQFLLQYKQLKVGYLDSLLNSCRF